MGNIVIKEVKTKSQLRKFVNVPNKMYRDNPYFVPAFYSDDLLDWNKKKNPAFKYAQARAFLAYKDGEIVGRIGAILSHRSNEVWHTNRMRFTQVDFIDDEEVSAALFKTVEDWAREKGCSEVHGPLGFTDMDREGMLVEGFDQESMFITYYNHPYYIRHLERLGYVKDVDWMEYKIYTPDKDDPEHIRLHRISEKLLSRGRYHKVELKKNREIKPYVEQAFRLVNVAYSKLYGVVPLLDEQIKKYSDKFVPLINPDYCCIVVDENNEMAGFGVGCGSVAKVMKRNKGRLLPFGWIGVLRAFKVNTVIDLLLIAVKPELQGQGINAVIIDHIMEGCIKNGIEYAESGPQLELNSKVRTQWKNFHVEQHKRRRCFIKSIV